MIQYPFKKLKVKVTKNYYEYYHSMSLLSHIALSYRASYDYAINSSYYKYLYVNNFSAKFPHFLSISEC